MISENNFSKNDLVGNSDPTTTTMLLIYHDRVAMNTNRNIRKSLAQINSGLRSKIPGFIFFNFLYLADKMEDDIYEVLEDFTPSSEDKTAEELKVSSGDHVNVITKQPSGWWFVQHEGEWSQIGLSSFKCWYFKTNSDRAGWVPANYLEPKSKDQKNKQLDVSNMGTRFISKERWDTFHLPF